jgi:hypothetical protein
LTAWQQSQQHHAGCLQMLSQPSGLLLLLLLLRRLSQCRWAWLQAALQSCLGDCRCPALAAHHHRLHWQQLDQLLLTQQGQS